MKFSTTIAIAGLMAAPALADGHADVEAGLSAFKQCQACHVVQDGDGNTLAGRNGKTGPNLYGVIGRAAGSVEGFRYRKSIVEAGEKGLVWDTDNIVAYVQDPTGFLREFLDDSKARSGMSFRVRKEEDAVNLAAFLATAVPDS